jgi:hypothetical protein
MGRARVGEADEDGRSFQSFLMVRRVSAWWPPVGRKTGRRRSVAGTRLPGLNTPALGPPMRAFNLTDFDRYVEEHGIAEEDWPAAFALWIGEVTGRPVPRFEKVERKPPADGIVIEGDDL